MSTRHGNAIVHHGPLSRIEGSDDAPGLSFLKSFLPILDSLDAQPPIANFVVSEVRFIINRGTALSLSELLKMFGMRSQKLQIFRHDVETAWQIEQGTGKWTVGFEGTSTTQLKGDDVLVTVAEMNVWELERTEEAEIKLVEARCWMDPTPVTARAKIVFAK
jgi:hypothetical protein